MSMCSCKSTISLGNTDSELTFAVVNLHVKLRVLIRHDVRHNLFESWLKFAQVDLHVKLSAVSAVTRGTNHTMLKGRLKIGMISRDTWN